MRKAKVSLSDKSPAPRRLKSPDWRYAYAVKLLEEWREPRKDDDAYIQGIYELLKKIRQSPVDEVEAYKDQHADVADALMMFENGPSYRTDVDTRILAGYSYDEIADVVGHPAGVVEQYVKCFFDVEDHLENYGYLNRWVIEPVMRAAPYSTEAFWKRLAIFGGRKMLEALERCSEHQLQKMFETLFDNLVLSKGIQAANGIAPNARNAVELIGLAKDNINERKKIEALAGPQKEDDAFTSQVVSVMLKSFTFGLMTQNSISADPLRAGAAEKAKMLALYGDNPPRFVENQDKGKIEGQ
jgi:hypothetical protein